MTAENSQWSPLLRWLKDNGYWSFRRVARMPRPIRRVGHRLLMRDGKSGQERASRSWNRSSELLAPIWADVSQLEEWMGATSALWPRTKEAAVGGQG